MKKEEKEMSEYYNQILLSTLNNVNNGSFIMASLLDKLKKDLGNEIKDYDILPILEKCTEQNIIRVLKNGLFVITEVGLDLLLNPDSAFQDLWNISSGESSESSLSSTQNPYEKRHIESLNHLNEVYSIYLSNLNKYIKFLLINMNKYNFEELVVDILIACGEAPFGEATKKSGDGGIDGFLYKTPLKQGIMPIQAKCYEENNLVGEQDIRDFIGSLHQSHHNGSYFVTTSTFTNKAVEKAKEHGIILIDGNQLVDLIIEFKIGLVTKHSLDFLITPLLSTFK